MPHLNGYLWGRVYSGGNGQLIPNAQVVSASPTATAGIWCSGIYFAFGSTNVTHTIRITANGFQPREEQVTLSCHGGERHICLSPV